MIIILFIKVVWIKFDNKYLAGIIESFLKCLSKYNEFKYLFIKDKSALMLSKY